MADLLPCPFCGETEHLRVYKVGSFITGMPDRPHQVRCKRIDCEDVQGPVAYGEWEAIAAWNRRALPAVTPSLTLAEVLELPEVKALVEALMLADATLSGANMNMVHVQRKVSTALRRIAEGKA